MGGNLRQTLLGFVRSFHVSAGKLRIEIEEGVPCAMVGCIFVSII
jgi:hypothetical protein